MPLAVPEPKQIPVSSLLEGLRQSIRALERNPTLDGPPGQASDPWTLGASEIDARLGPTGLHAFGLHEIKPCCSGNGVSAGDWAAAIGFASALAVRRLAQVSTGSIAGQSIVLWCATSAFFAEQGSLYGAGLADLGLAPSRLLLVDAPRTSDALWVIEEGLKSKGVALVVAMLDDMGLTPARRLALAAEAGRTPGLILTHSRSPATAATATRWSVARVPSAPHPFDPEAPGAARYGVVLQRCRHQRIDPLVSPLVLEWSDATHRFRMVAPLADRSGLTRRAGVHTL